MTKREIEELIALGEGLHLEFKSSVSHLGREICSFANSGGGRILLGVDDNGRIVGVPNRNRTISEVQCIARSMDPALAPSIQSVGEVVVIAVPEGKEKPYSANGKFYLREAANTQQMRRNEIREYFFKEGLIRWDEQPCREFHIAEDLSVRRYSAFARSAGISRDLDRNDVLENLQVIVRRRMTNAGAMLFSKRPTRFFFCSRINCAVFQGKEKTKILDQQIFDGNIIDSFDKAIAYLKANLNTEYIIRGGPRQELLELPEPALHEALMNAIAHRDYRSTGNIQVEIYRDRVQIVSPGGLVSGLSQRDLGRVSLPRNPLLFALLHRIDLVENVGSGIKRIRSEMKGYGLKEPLIETGEVWFCMTFMRKPAQKSLKDMRNDQQKSSPGTGVKTRVKTRVKARVKTRVKTRAKILSMISENNAITREELAERLGLTVKGIDWNLKKLREQGVLKRVGPDRGGSWRVTGADDS